MTEYTGNPLLWVALVALVAAAVLISRQRRAARALRQQVQGLRDHYTELENDYGKSVQAAQERAEDETKTVLKSAMRTLQGLAAEQQLVLSRLQNKYGDSPLLQDLLEIDHTNSQFGRRAQSIAVLCDGWLGGRRDTASVYDVVRSAQGRIRHFRRVDILSQVDFGITSRAVEPVALALAELLDNATSYSSPDTVVEINIRTVPKGICVVVDDAGVGMSDEERARADKLLATERASGVAGLGNPPQFGFAVIGLLCERFGFEVSVDSSSPYGGVRAVVLLPHELLTAMPEKKAPAPAARGTARPVPDAGGPEAAALASSETGDGLPRRRRKRPMAIVPGSASAPRAAGRSDSEQAQVMGAFQRGTRSGRVTETAGPDGADRTSDTPGASSEGHEVS
ncbi:sensor histidine kinase [Streptomyces sp. AD681]|uniref:histidine kinase n=1 Tax=Streptomyces tendae TaxID=1932 RepID=A0A6B3QN57_STRTE|nr:MULTISPECIES: sensor histidine kinase [Streptomyces]MBQ0963267.1 sensor histidine kinase [Streptomyces sp. RK74B]MBQ1002842.1 sensor histidine kinase [Streptomyces sp. RK23]MCW1099589.1 sensor histidine kinase [Streptomyces sp. RS2]MDA5141594.1 sensor histidine kinase [Streptomyces sp. AD681]NEV89493.1 sensor histidine kinase [Streptomyces tendae]